MKATELLKQDHDEAQELIEQLEEMESGEPLQGPTLELFGKLKSALALHTLVEERVFYHPLANLPETQDLIHEAYTEHRAVDELLVKMSQPGGDWEAQLSDLKDMLEDHIEEEENDLFPKAERLLGEDQLDQIGREIENMKEGKAAIAGVDHRPQ